MQLVGAGKEADFAVSEGGEVMDGCADPGTVIKQDGAGFRLGQFEFGENDRDIVERELVEYRFLFTESEDCDAVHLARRAREHAAQIEVYVRRLADATGRPFERVEADVERRDWLDAEAARADGIVDEIERPRPRATQAG